MDLELKNFYLKCLTNLAMLDIISKRIVESNDQQEKKTCLT